MFQIIGIQINDKRVVVASSATAGEALVHFRAAQNLFPAVVVLSPEGSEINGFELSRLYQAEEREKYA